jgi:hypothetical protein
VSTEDIGISAISGGDHFIEFLTIGTWQAGDLHQARCECGWQSQRRADRRVVDTETQR